MTAPGRPSMNRGAGVPWTFRYTLGEASDAGVAS